MPMHPFTRTMLIIAGIAACLIVFYLEGSVF